MKVTRSVTVSASPERAFRAFTEEIGGWWPLQTHSLFGESSRGCG